MYTLKFYNNDISKEEVLTYDTFREALYFYIEYEALPYWECDLKDLKIFKNNVDITKEVKKILEGFANE